MLNLHNIVNTDIEEIESTQFDLGIFASGYDGRASFLAKKILPLNIKNNIILGFSEYRNSPKRRENDSFYLEKYNNPFILSGSSDRELYLELNKIFDSKFKEKEELKLLLDYTSMSRLWYSGIMNYIKLQDNKKITVYLNYCMGDYKDEIHEYGYNSIHSLPSHEGTLTSKGKTVLVIPIGFYPDIIRAVIEEIEPNDIIGILGIPSIIEKYEKRCLEVQQNLNSDIKKWLNCPVFDIEAIFRTYAEIINNNTNKEVMFLPLGPKTFNIASILIGQKFEHITCLYLKSKSNEMNSVEATGDHICTKVIYKNEYFV